MKRKLKFFCSRAFRVFMKKKRKIYKITREK